jgi:hypothetical protein
MVSGSLALGEVGAACFGVAVSYITYRRLVRSTDKLTVSDLAVLAGAIGGAAVTGLFAPETGLFAWYAIGLLGGLALFFAIFGRLNGLQQLAAVLGVRLEPGGGSGPQEPGAPDAGEAR